MHVNWSLKDDAKHDREGIACGLVLWMSGKDSWLLKHKSSDAHRSCSLGSLTWTCLSPAGCRERGGSSLACSLAAGGQFWPRVTASVIGRGKAAFVSAQSCGNRPGRGRASLSCCLRGGWGRRRLAFIGRGIFLLQPSGSLRCQSSRCSECACACVSLSWEPGRGSPGRRARTGGVRCRPEWGLDGTGHRWPRPGAAPHVPAGLRCRGRDRTAEPGAGPRPAAGKRNRCSAPRRQRPLRRAAPTSGQRLLPPQVTRGGRGPGRAAPRLRLRGRGSICGAAVGAGRAVSGVAEVDGWRLVASARQPRLTQQPSRWARREQAAGLPPLQSTRAGSGGSNACVSRRGL